MNLMLHQCFIDSNSGAWACTNGAAHSGRCGWKAASSAKRGSVRSIPTLSEAKGLGQAKEKMRRFGLIKTTFHSLL